MLKSRQSVQLLRRFAAIARTVAPGKLVETAVLTVLVSVTEGVGLLLLVPLLQVVGLDTGQGSLTGIVTIVASAFQAVGLKPTLGAMLTLYFLIVTARAVLQQRQSVLSTTVQQAIVTSWRHRLYRAMTGMQWIAFARTRSSSYMQLLTGEVDRLGTVAFCLIDLATTGVTSAVFILVAFRVSPAVTGLVLVLGFTLGLFVRTRIARAHAVGERLSLSLKELYSALDQHLASVKIAKAYGTERQHIAVFEKTSEELADVSLDNARAHTAFRAYLAIASAALLAMVVYVSTAVIGVSTAQLFLLLFVFARLVPRLTDIYERIQTMAAVLPSLTAVLEAEQHSLEAAEPVVTRHEPVSFRDRLEFDRVTFDYAADGRQPAVRDVTLSIRFGQTTALVGPSGSGKSTLADMLMGLLSPASGRVLVDGIPLTAERLGSWREQIGYVVQDTFLFHDTIRANLLWARMDADETEIWRALRLASADTFVSALPNRLDTVVGDRGVLVSGGERQRLSLARALLRRPALLVLDEATSSLDSENEARIQQAIERLHQELTIILITHRLSTIRQADMIHVIENGRVVESGTWEELIGSRSSRFRQLCLAQGIDDGPARRLHAVGR